MPKVRRDPLTEDELSAATAAVIETAENRAAQVEGSGRIAGRTHEEGPVGDDDNESGDDNGSVGEGGGGSEELIEWDDDEFLDEGCSDSE
jgi:hypothetical protein